MNDEDFKKLLEKYNYESRPLTYSEKACSVLIKEFEVKVE